MRRQRGFSLVELMAVVGISSIVGVTFFGVMFTQNLAYLQRLDELDAHQNGRAALSIMRRYIKAARFGFGQGVDAGGVAGLGRCFLTGTPAQTQANCDGVDSGHDRLRTVSLVANGDFAGDTTYKAGDNCTTTSSLIGTASNPNVPYNAGDLAAIGGSCSGGTPFSAAADLIVINADSGSNGTCAHRYSFARVEDGQPTTSCTYSSSPPFSFGRASVVDFFVGQLGSVTGLLMQRNAGLNNTPQELAAFDVDDMQVEYGIDTSAVPDHTVDAWCSSPQTTTCSLADSNGNAIGAAGLYNRISAVHLYVRVRTPSPRVNLVTYPPIADPNYLRLGGTVPAAGSGYNYWLYSTTVDLRNNNP